jgi:predicted DNA-binding transcriptional regulator AlpA
VQEIYISFPELRPKHQIPFCRLHVNRLMARGDFPAAVWLSANRKVWKLSEIEAWKASRGTVRPATQTADAA